MAWFGAPLATGRSGRSTTRSLVEPDDPDRLTNLDVISLMGGEDSAHVAHLQIVHAKFGTIPMLLWMLVLTLLFPLFLMLITVPNPVIGSTETMGDIRQELSDTFGCLPEAMMMMYGGMEICDEWLPSETIPGLFETIVVLPNNHRESILRHMKRSQGFDLRDLKILPPDSTMVHSFGKTAPLAWRERFKKADLEMRVIAGAMKVGTDPKVNPMIEAQTSLSQKMAGWEQEKFNVFNMRHHERYTLLTQINTTMMVLFRENQFLRDVIVADFALHRESAPIAVEEETMAALDVDQEELAAIISADDGSDKSSRSTVVRLVTAHANMLRNAALRKVWELKLAQRDIVRAYIRNFAVWLPLLLVVMIGCYVRRSDLSEKIAMQRTVEQSFNPDTLVIDSGLELHANGPGEFFSIPSFGSLYSEWRHRVLNTSLDSGTLYPGGPPGSQRAARKYNVVVGAIRFRSVRVASDSCTVPPQMQKFYKHCYAAYSASTATEEPYGPNAKSLEMSSMSGILASYGGGGYSIDLPPNHQAFEMFDQMEANGFVDEATRAVVIDMNLYNGPLKKFACIRLLYEVPETGGIVRTMKVLFADVYRFDTASKMVATIFSFLVVSYCYWFVTTEVKGIRKLGFQYFVNTFSDIWTTLEWVNVFMILAQVVIRLQVRGTLVVARELIELPAGDCPSFTGVKVIWLMTVCKGTFEAFNLFILVMRAIQFTAVHPRIAYHVYVYSKAKTGFAAFFVLFFQILTPFIAMGKIIFGEVLESYSNVWRSVVTLVCGSIGHFSYSELLEVDPILGLVYFILFVCLISFSMVALVVGILMYSFKETKQMLDTEAGVQEIQGMAFSIQTALKQKWIKFVDAKGKEEKEGSCVRHGRVLFEALLRSDLDGNYHIDAEELAIWMAAYPEVKELLFVDGVAACFRKYRVKNDQGLRKREMYKLKRDIDAVMEDIEFYREQESSMDNHKRQVEEAMFKEFRKL